jgi:serine phosphatase RsbU (regulator of sigma subunit)/putative methionine-R-sulfoxide reductase with GAF domain
MSTAKQTIWEDVGEKIERTTLLWEISRAFHSTRELQPLLELILQAATSLIDAEHCSVLLLDEEAGRLKFAAATGADPQKLRFIFVPLDNSIAGQVVRQDKTLLISDVKEEQRFYREIDAIADLTARSILAVPMSLRDEVTGVLELINKRGGGEFAQEDIEVAFSLAEQAAIAIENVRLLDDLEHAYDGLLDLERLGREVVELPAGVNAMLSSVVEKILSFVEAGGGALWVLSENKEDIVCVSAEGLGRETWLDMPLKIGEGIAGWVMDRAEPLLIKDVEQSKWAALLPEWQGERPPRDEARQGPTSIVCAPLISREGVFGAMALVNGPGDRPFGERDETLLAGLASSVALAVKNAELRESHQKAAGRQALLEEIIQVFHSTVELDKLLPTIFEKVVRTIGAEGGSIWLLDKSGETLTCVIAEGGGGEALRGTKLNLGEGVAGWVAANKQPTIIADVAQDDRHAGYVDQRIKFKTRSIMSAPLITKGESLGAINVVNKLNGGVFVKEDENLLVSLANNAALAIKNAQLVEELKEAERIKREIEIASRIQMSLLPRHPPQWEGLDLAGRCIPAQNVGGDYYDFFSTIGGERGIIIADVSGHGIGSALMMTTTRSTLRFESLRQHSPAMVLAQTCQAVHEDLSNAELFITVFYATYNPDSRVLTWANGGHNTPVLWRRRDDAPMFLDADGMLIGFLKDVDYEQRQMVLEPGDVLVMYTDGVTEAKNPSGEMFGEERLCQVIRENIDLPALGLLDSIYNAVWSHSDTVTQYDDITATVMKVTA